MAFARALKQLTPALASQLLVSTSQAPVRCGIHHQLPCALVSLTHLHTATQMQQSSLFSQLTDRRRSRGIGKSVKDSKKCPFFQFASLPLIQLYGCAGHIHFEHSTHDMSGPMFRSGHVTRQFASNSEEADKPQYPIKTPEHVYVYNGPLAVTVTRLKVRQNSLLAELIPCDM